MDEILITFEEWCFEFSPLVGGDNNPINFKGKDKIIDNAEEETTLWSVVGNTIINEKHWESDQYYITQEHYDNTMKIIVQFPN
jgi:hypothetical protein